MRLNKKSNVLSLTRLARLRRSAIFSLALVSMLSTNVTTQDLTFASAKKLHIISSHITETKSRLILNRISSNRIQCDEQYVEIMQRQATSNQLLLDELALIIS